MGLLQRAVSADSRWLVTGGHALDNSARVWDLLAAADPCVLHHDQMTSVAISAIKYKMPETAALTFCLIMTSICSCYAVPTARACTQQKARTDTELSEHLKCFAA